MLRLKIILQSKIFIVFSILFILTYVLFFTKVVKYNSKYSDKTKNVSGIVIDFNIDGDKLNLLIKAQEKVKCTYYIKDEKEKDYLVNNLFLGTLVYLEGNFSVPNNNTIPNTFNYKKYLYNKKIYKIIEIDKIILDNSKIDMWNDIKNNIFKKLKNYSSFNYLQAFILGDNSYIADDVYEIYRSNGVTHLFAVSGMHVSILVGFIIYILNKFKIKDILIIVIVILFLSFFMFLTGFSASVIRAGLLYIFLLINKKIGLNLNTLIVLYLVLFILLLINPFYVFDLGFIYSFMTAFGLIIFNKKIQGGYIKKIMLVSTIAFMFSLPITLYNFYEFNLLTILNNIIIVPFVSIGLFPLALITFIFPFLDILLVYGIKILEFINSTLNVFSINIIVAKINIVFIFIYYIGVYLIYKKGYRYIGLLVLLVFIFKLVPFLDNNNYVYYLDVGQGDASLIITENRKDIVMIDTGGKIDFQKKDWQKRNKEFNLADNIITFLKSLGINTVDLLVITHGDKDHLGYAKDIMKSINIKALMLNNNQDNSLEKQLRQNVKISCKNIYQGKYVNINNINDYIESDENDSSLVLNVTLDNKNFLFMGDAPKKVEQHILKKYKFKPSILKLGHHGSNTSSDFNFLNSYKPKYAIISAGRNNRYNHPAKETVDALNRLKIDYFNTQTCGTIKFIFRRNEEKIIFYTP
ncbi:MAG: DNA internalization-related competence protein ComEC/Rec2 [Bacilli bacterium]|nr:DNA internalization-related competence protein ComEC/Rec2 [Bacilli bacterium]